MKMPITCLCLGSLFFLIFLSIEREEDVKGGGRGGRSSRFFFPWHHKKKRFCVRRWQKYDFCLCFFYRRWHRYKCAIRLDSLALSLSNRSVVRSFVRLLFAIGVFAASFRFAFASFLPRRHSQTWFGWSLVAGDAPHQMSMGWEDKIFTSTCWSNSILVQGFSYLFEDQRTYQASTIRMLVHTRMSIPVFPGQRQHKMTNLQLSFRGQSK